MITTEAARDIGVEPIIGRSIETPAGDWADIVGVVDVRDDSVPRVFHYMPAAKSRSAVGDGDVSRAAVTPSQTTVLDVNIVSPNYFEFMGIPLVAGRNFMRPPMPAASRSSTSRPRICYFNGDAVGARDHRSARPPHARSSASSDRRKLRAAAARRSADRLFSDGAGLSCFG